MASGDDHLVDGVRHRTISPTWPHLGSMPADDSWWDRAAESERQTSPRWAEAEYRNRANVHRAGLIVDELARSVAISVFTNSWLTNPTTEDLRGLGELLEAAHEALQFALRGWTAFDLDLGHPYRHDPPGTGAAGS